MHFKYASNLPEKINGFVRDVPESGMLTSKLNHFERLWTPVLQTNASVFEELKISSKKLKCLDQLLDYDTCTVDVSFISERLRYLKEMELRKRNIKVKNQ